MSLIKEIYDVSKDVADVKLQREAIKRALRMELKINHKLLQDVKSKNLDDERRIDIIKKLDMDELREVYKSKFPFSVISNKKVSEQVAERYKVKRLVGRSIEHIIEALCVSISYLKKDFDNTNNNLTMKLFFIYKYNGVLIELLK